MGNVIFFAVILAVCYNVFSEFWKIFQMMLSSTPLKALIFVCIGMVFLMVVIAGVSDKKENKEVYSKVGLGFFIAGVLLAGYAIFS